MRRRKTKTRAQVVALDTSFCVLREGLTCFAFVLVSFLAWLGPDEKNSMGTYLGTMAIIR